MQSLAPRVGALPLEPICESLEDFGLPGGKRSNLGGEGSARAETNPPQFAQPPATFSSTL